MRFSSHHLPYSTLASPVISLFISFHPLLSISRVGKPIHSDIFIFIRFCGLQADHDLKFLCAISGSESYKCLVLNTNLFTAMQCRNRESAECMSRTFLWSAVNNTRHYCHIYFLITMIMIFSASCDATRSLLHHRHQLPPSSTLHLTTPHQN